MAHVLLQQHIPAYQIWWVGESIKIFINITPPPTFYWNSPGWVDGCYFKYLEILEIFQILFLKIAATMYIYLYRWFLNTYV